MESTKDGIMDNIIDLRSIIYDNIDYVYDSMSSSGEMQIREKCKSGRNANQGEMQIREKCKSGRNANQGEMQIRREYRLKGIVCSLMRLPIMPLALPLEAVLTSNQRTSSSWTASEASDAAISM